jgi:hypothetical protein
LLINILKKDDRLNDINSKVEREDMKKMLLAVFFILMMSVAWPAWATPMDILIDPVDGATYNNPAYNLPNSNPDTEGDFLEDILGFPVEFISKMETPPVNGSLLLVGYDPGFSWLYAVIKFDGKNDGWYGIQDEGDDLVTYGPGLARNPAGQTYAISHVTFFGPGNQVPEPNTIFLLGLGLVGVACVRRKLSK